MKGTLTFLLDAMDKIATEHEEVTDTAVREHMGEAIFRSWINPEPGYSLPVRFGMFSNEGNKAVRTVLEQFVDKANIEAEKLNLLTPQARLDAFQNIEAQSQEGNTYDEYFGHRENF